MKILITSGGTSEAIDRVRTITNMASGRLGSLIADAFLEAGNPVTYVCGPGSALPKHPGARVLPIGGAADLLRTLEEELPGGGYDALIHAMAVSDYAVASTADLGDMARRMADILLEEELPREPEALARRLEALFTGFAPARVQPKKLSSTPEHMLLLLRKNPKVIARIKELCPPITLVGFKLLVGAPDEELLAVGHRLLTKNRCDLVLANDLERIDGDAHHALLIRPDRSYETLRTKQSIARATVRAVLRQRGEGI